MIELLTPAHERPPVGLGVADYESPLFPRPRWCIATDGPDGIGGHSGSDGPYGSILDAIEAPSAQDEAGTTSAPSGPASDFDVRALSPEVKAGSLTAHETIEELVDALTGQDLPPEYRDGIRELVFDSLANDPHLHALIGQI